MGKKVNSQKVSKSFEKQKFQLLWNYCFKVKVSERKVVLLEVHRKTVKMQSINFKTRARNVNKNSGDKTFLYSIEIEILILTPLILIIMIIPSTLIEVGIEFADQCEIDYDKLHRAVVSFVILSGT